ncbi:ATP-binding protein [Streptomyces sp. NPDC059477]|uniref:ATP-binding protein n=1 Tax=Streptomyces sp. NPDC059477 TaxID=3346847 RepID=UPI0036881FE5
MNGHFPHQYRMSLTVAEHSARHVRRIARTLLREWGVPELTEAVELGTTELIANVVRHVQDRHCTVVIARQPTGARVEVTDSSPQLPAPPSEFPLDSENGRGLLILESAADKWGVDVRPEGGKTVWFECASPPSRPDPDRGTC